MLGCPECGLIYDVVWNNDRLGSPDLYCPRCGEADPLREPDEDEETDHAD